MGAKTIASIIAPLVILGIGVVPLHVGADSGGRDTEPTNRVTGCGVERWAVKTGMDVDARLVNQKTVTPTTIAHLRALPAPAYLPLHNRVRPVETTVWGLTAVLLRYKQEPDSDYHLVLADSGGRTMIAEIPAPQCVGSASLFLPAIRVVRRIFTARFHPTDLWQRVHATLSLTGLGFFDFKHGQSGVAPNAIELHPVLSIHWTGQAAPSIVSVHGTPTPAPATHSGFSVTASVSPNPVSYGDDPTLTAHSAVGAVCTASVVYSTGRPPSSFNGQAQTVGQSGTVAWSWHMESRGTSGTATVTCTLGSRTGGATTTFAIA